MYTYQQVLDALNKAVADKPEGYVYVNPNFCNAADDVSSVCVYYDDVNECPSCLIGTILHDSFGVSLDKLKEMDDQYSVSWMSDPGNMRGEFTEMAFDLMSRAQARQDRGDTWRGAVDLAVAVTKSAFPEGEYGNEG